MAKTDLKNVLVSVFKISSAGFYKYMGHLGKTQFCFPFPSLPLDYFDVQDLKFYLASFHLR